MIISKSMNREGLVPRLEGHSNFFFFQAEDGIRDGRVTGVQTCALPIYSKRSNTHLRAAGKCCSALNPGERAAYTFARTRRSEERRVGKECRYRWSPYHQKPKQYLQLKA